MNEMSRTEIIEIGEALEADGVAEHRAALTRLALMAHARGVTPAAAGILLDDAAPEIVPLRAYAVVANAIEADEQAVEEHLEPIAV